MGIPSRSISHCAVPQQQSTNDGHPAELERRTPDYVPVLRLSGIALAALGLITTIASNAAYDPNTCTKHEYEVMRLWNDIGWASMALGGGAFGVSFFLTPRSTSNASPDLVSPGPARAALVQVRGSF